eukprot:gb/GECG01011186.1/.p1 GENE.gb/GECG01011186.1/~~gb/GECG01011186.1/.p1  ORF type:complete len:332 (+),score=16.36 gb/GECG01011186.1/:1-996(+)
MGTAQSRSLYGYYALYQWSRCPRWLKATLLLFLLKSCKDLLARVRQKSLEGKVVLITGAGSGIGRLLSLKMARLGAKLALVDLNFDSVEQTAVEARHFGATARAYQLDVTDRQRVYDMADTIQQEVGPVDILVNNAGIVSGKRLLENTDESISKTFDVNTISMFWTVRAFLPQMLERNSGHLVTISSASAYTGVVGLADYAASKWGAFGFHESMRLELKKLGKTGVNTTCVCPFYINTGMFEGVQTRFSWILPILEPDYVASQTLRAIQQDQEVLCMPVIVYLVPLLRGLLPTSLFDFGLDVLGVCNSMDNFVGRTPANSQGAVPPPRQDE